MRSNSTTAAELGSFRFTGSPSKRTWGSANTAAAARTSTAPVLAARSKVRRRSVVAVRAAPADTSPAEPEAGRRNRLRTAGMRVSEAANAMRTPPEAMMPSCAMPMKSVGVNARKASTVVSRIATSGHPI